VLATAASNVVFWTWSATPPRLAVTGLDDTLVTRRILGAANPHGISRLADLYATMPSLHVAWATWCAFAAVIALRGRWRHLAWLYPAVTTLVVLATANHFLLDTVAGAAMAVLGLACAGGVRHPAAEGTGGEENNGGDRRQPKGDEHGRDPRLRWPAATAQVNQPHGERGGVGLARARAPVVGSPGTRKATAGAGRPARAAGDLGR
jgi:hypothetical protein